MRGMSGRVKMTNKIDKAAAFARMRHDGQHRKGLEKIPYATHCEEVAHIVTEHGADNATIIAAWLHDTVEDTNTTLEEIGAEFGATVAALVGEVTDDPTLSKADQRAAQIALAPNKSRGAALIKAADQISNMRSIVKTPPYWSREKALAYIDKASAVVAGLPAPASLKAVFEEDASAARRMAATFPVG
jgi:guanosine-3',5'-bis(diphosphate) 3'-pyrophosphohydrolase